MATMRRKLKEFNFEARYIVHLDGDIAVEGDWAPCSDEEFEAMCLLLEDFRSLRHFSVVRDGVDLFINPLKILYIEACTRDLPESE